MSVPEDRVAAPSNGHEPALSPDDAEAAAVETSDLGSGRPSPATGALRLWPRSWWTPRW